MTSFSTCTALADPIREIGAERRRRVDAEVECVPYRSVGGVDPTRDPDGDDPDARRRAISIRPLTGEHVGDEPGHRIDHRGRSTRGGDRPAGEQPVRRVERRDPGAGGADVDADRGDTGIGRNVARHAIGQRAPVVGAPVNPSPRPAVRPAVTLRWTIRKNTITGIAITVEPAITPPQSVPRAPSLNSCSHTGSVLEPGRCMITRAKMNSFHAWMNANTPVATSPGRDERQRDATERAEAAGAVDHRRFLQLERHAVDEAAQRPDRERQDEHEIGERQTDRSC